MRPGGIAAGGLGQEWGSPSTPKGRAERQKAYGGGWNNKRGVSWQGSLVRQIPVPLSGLRAILCALVQISLWGCVSTTCQAPCLVRRCGASLRVFEVGPVGRSVSAVGRGRNRGAPADSFRAATGGPDETSGCTPHRR